MWFTQSSINVNQIRKVPLTHSSSYGLHKTCCMGDSCILYLSLIACCINWRDQKRWNFRNRKWVQDDVIHLCFLPEILEEQACLTDFLVQISNQNSLHGVISDCALCANVSCKSCIPDDQISFILCLPNWVF